MKLIFTQPEIEQILRAHVNANVTLATGSDYTIDFVATRSDDGITATIEIPYMSVTSFPAIANAAGPTPVTPVVTAATATVAKTAAKQTPKKSASSILGGGLTPATEPAQNPEPVTAEATPDAAANPAAPDAADAPFAGAVDVAEAEAGDAAEAPAAPVRGPSLFGNSAFKL
jgi:hypothetical protein